MNSQLAGFILRSKDRHLTARFYKELGLTTCEHEHGGPKHYEMGPVADNFVGEVYLASEGFSRDALMLYVESIEKALVVVASYGHKPWSADIRHTPTMSFVYVNDPDGRLLLLIEKK